MKIEKISDTQIRCTLNYSDLHDRSLSLGELAYGSARARELFHEMIQRAAEEVGFQPEDTPLMVEAIPLSNDGIILNISKIEDPDEIDTRFTRFAPDIENVSAEADMIRHHDAENLLESLKNLLGEDADAAVSAAPKQAKDITVPKSPAAKEAVVIYRFRDLDSLILAASVLRQSYRGENSLYRDNDSHIYYLTVHRSAHSPKEFNRVCNILTEYGEKLRVSPDAEYYYQEHMTWMVRKQALQKLAPQ